MKIKLLEDARVLIQKGKTVETEREYALSLIRLGKAEEVIAQKKEKKDK